VVVSSFDTAVLRAVRGADGRLALGMLWSVTHDPRAGLDEARSSGFGAVHPFVASVDADLVADAHRAGLDVTVWTVNAPEDLQAMVAIGVDGLVTDRLAEALAVVAAADGDPAPSSEWRGTGQVHQDGRP
jgi:glycerophosphoryl diester phosphodiesterase